MSLVLFTFADADTPLPGILIDEQSLSNVTNKFIYVDAAPN